MGVYDIPVISTVCDVAGEAAATLISAPFDWLASAMGAAAGWLFEAVWTVFDSTTLVDVTSGEYVGVYNLIFGIAVFVMLLFFCLQLITGMIRREPAALSRAALGLAKSVLGSFVVITLTALLLEIVDQLSVGIIQAAGETTATMGDKIALLVAGLTALNVGAPGVGAILTIFLAALAIAAAAIVWLSLLIRKALLLVAVVLAPFVFSGASWDATRGWISKWAMFVVALVLSKLVLVVILLVAVTQVSAPIDADLSNIADPLAGVVLMALAGFAPYMTYRFLSFIGFDLYNSMGSEQEAKSALNRPVPTPGKPQGGDPKQVLDGKGDGGGKKASGGSGGADGGPKAKPTPPPSSAGGAGASGGSAGAAGAGGGAAAAGPIAAGVVAGAAVVKAAATAGPKAGQALADQADHAASGAEQPGSAPVTPHAPPPSQPLPKNPNSSPPPKPTKE
ncbi:conjugal transfer protein TrbL [Brevibacterium ravenspurgense]|uniref:Conjugal transfer protein TrbL n=1 Tax=Brevibacterium ravenspurgense TaxID=479117 RepID=A0A2I1IFK7_9MICO|nr:conjugal transfer protein TrbL [Brevibacterium ravenspurgense]PKY69908.1 conjugal transfer protein TrbL [Brevibacterium ravenspurgense]